MWAKCSVWPASWKSARQSSGPPIGLITSTIRFGISIGAQKARGDLLGRELDVDLDVLLAAQVDAEVGQRRLERGEHSLGREGGIPVAGRGSSRGVSQRWPPGRGEGRAACSSSRSSARS